MYNVPTNMEAVYVITAFIRVIYGIKVSVNQSQRRIILVLLLICLFLMHYLQFLKNCLDDFYFVNFS